MCALAYCAATHELLLQKLDPSEFAWLKDARTRSTVSTHVHMLLPQIYTRDLYVIKVTVKKERIASPRPRKQAATTPVKREAQRALPHLRSRVFTCVAESSDEKATQDGGGDDSSIHAAVLKGGDGCGDSDDGGGEAADDAPRTISLSQLSVHNGEESRAADNGRSIKREHSAADAAASAADSLLTSAIVVASPAKKAKSGRHTFVWS